MLSPGYNRSLHVIALLTAAATFPLIFMGGLVTSHGAGMSVPDWPNSYGYNMFAFPVRMWTGGILYEHTHRLYAASVVGPLCIVTCIWTWSTEPRRWVRWLGTGMLAFVIVQGVLGGLRVVLVKLNLAIVHACFAQAFFCLAAMMVVVTSRWWFQAPDLSQSADAIRGKRLIVACVFATVTIYAQLIVGATIRHYQAGLAVPDVPLAYGKLIPQTDPASLAAINQHRAWDLHLPAVSASQIWLHMGHRIGAILVTMVVLHVTTAVFLRHRAQRGLLNPAIILVVLLVAQVTLGILTVVQRKPADIASAHVAVGALILMTMFVMTVRGSAIREGASHGPRVAADRRRASLSSGRLSDRVNDMSMHAADMLDMDPTVAIATPSRWVDFYELTKPRMNFLVLLTTLVGFYGFPPCAAKLDWKLLIPALLGTALCAASASVLNQLVERDLDALMPRTRNRPLAAGRLGVGEAMVYAMALGIVGVATLLLMVNLLTALLGAFTLISYVFVYTPLKRVTTLNTVLGAIPGAIPPLMGFTAVHNAFSPGALAVFAILFFWQMPHFLAIAILYRKDYALAGFKMLPVVDENLSATSRQIILYAVALIPVSLMPTYVGLAGPAYFGVALMLGLAFLSFAASCAISRDRLDARKLFFASIIYLPALLGVMMLDRG